MALASLRAILVVLVAAGICGSAFFGYKLHERNQRLDALIASVETPDDSD